MGDNHQLPRSGHKREFLREKGQFWTPDWIAEAMVGYVIHNNDCNSVFDPAVGTGVFFKATKAVGSEVGREFALQGTEIDPDTLELARQNGLSAHDLANVQITDFVLNPPLGRFKAIVANPPYIRHHRLSPQVKAGLKAFGTRLIGKSLDGRAGIHIYFLLRALQLLDSGGKLAFIMPADTCEGVFAPTLWGWITKKYCLEAVVTFPAEASPFPGVDTNPIIFMIRNTPPEEYLLWCRCTQQGSSQLKWWTLSGLTREVGNDLHLERRRLAEALATGLSRPATQAETNGPILGHFAKVLRGVATGANDFFLLTPQQANWLEIPDEFLFPTIARTRDVMGNIISTETLKAIAKKGRPILLFSPDGRPMHEFPLSVRKYLEEGETLGLPRKPLIAQRRPWYKMEVRAIPPFLFAYLGRRNSRFIRNLAGVVPLTGFLCVYPLLNEPDYIDKLWHVLQHPVTTANLSLVGKTYGGNALKVEPRALERLPLPPSVVAEIGLTLPVKLLL
jgi:hypothetical protein